MNMNAKVPALIQRVTMLLRSSPFQLGSFVTEEDSSTVSFTVKFTPDTRRGGGKPSRHRRKQRRQTLQRSQPHQVETPETSSPAQHNPDAASHLPPDSARENDDLEEILNYYTQHTTLDPPIIGTSLPHPEPTTSDLHLHRFHCKYHSNHHTPTDNFAHFNNLVTEKFKIMDNVISTLKEEAHKSRKVINDLQTTVKKKFGPILRHYCSYCCCMRTNPHLCPIRKIHRLVDYNLFQVCEGPNEESLKIVSAYSNKILMRDGEERKADKYMAKYNEKKDLFLGTLPSNIEELFFITTAPERRTAGCKDGKDILLTWDQVPSLGPLSKNTYIIETKYPGQNWTPCASSVTNSFVARMEDLSRELYQPSDLISDEKPESPLLESDLYKDLAEEEHLEVHNMNHFKLYQSRAAFTRARNHTNAEYIDNMTREDDVKATNHLLSANKNRDKIEMLNKRVAKLKHDKLVEFRIIVENANGKSVPSTPIPLGSSQTKTNDEKQEEYYERLKEKMANTLPWKRYV